MLRFSSDSAANRPEMNFMTELCISMIAKNAAALNGTVEEVAVGFIAESDYIEFEEKEINHS